MTANTQAMSEPSSPPVPELDIKMLDGDVLAGLKEETIVHGVREGWLRLDDLCRQGDKEWQPIRTALGKNYAIEVLIHPDRVYGKQWGFSAAVVIGLIAGIGGFLSGSMTNLGLNLLQAIIVMALTVGAAVAALADLNWTARTGGLFVACVGFNIVTGMQADVGFFFSFVLGAVIGTLLTGGTCAAVAYFVGYALGWMVGRLRRNQYRLPEIRQPRPDWAGRDTHVLSIDTVFNATS